MSRRLPGPKPGTLVEFTTKGPDSIRVFVRAPCEADRRQFLVESSRVLKVTREGAQRGEVTVTLGDVFERRARTVAAWVVRVEGYVDHEGQPIADGVALAEKGETEVLVEVESFVESLLVLAEDEQKKSVASPGSAPAVTPASSGTAMTASSASSSSSGGATGAPASSGT